mmetsp:Transcript_46674/g.117427  ORF Transcript_46674/g.117427 Transcript_46674/m.117427 type:complete len:233 (-) Transcript_46674:395-1093(-)
MAEALCSLLSLVESWMTEDGAAELADSGPLTPWIARMRSASSAPLNSCSLAQNVAGASSKSSRAKPWSSLNLKCSMAMTSSTTSSVPEDSLRRTACTTSAPRRWTCQLVSNRIARRTLSSWASLTDVAASFSATSGACSPNCRLILAKPEVTMSNTRSLSPSAKSSPCPMCMRLLVATESTSGFKNKALAGHSGVSPYTQEDGHGTDCPVCPARLGHGSSCATTVTYFRAGT